MTIFRRKTIESVRENIKHDHLAKTLGTFDLLMLGIGAIIGTGIFVLTGVSAAETAGPAVVLSFGLAALTCMFVALCYTEVASMIPTSGNVYAYAYIGLGEIVGWLVGWFLIFEYSAGASTVATGWSAYLLGILRSMGVDLPEQFIHGPFEGGIVNLPAVLITLVLTAVLTKGMKESKVLNNVLVITKLAAISLFLFIAIPHADVENWNDFMPFGVNGIFTGAAIVFFAFIGFDSLASAAEECKNPKKDLIIGIIGSVVVCAVLYMAVAAFLTLMVPYHELNNSEPLAYALRVVGSNMGGTIVAVGGIAAMTSVLLVLMYCQTRIFMVMSRDGLLPKIFSKVDPACQTPIHSTIIVGCAVALTAGIFPTTVIAQLTSLGTLLGFIAVSIVMMVLRYQHPKYERTFKCPAVYLVGTIAALMSFFLMFELLKNNLYTVIGWATFGLLIYFIYGYRNSNLMRYHKQ